MRGSREGSRFVRAAGATGAIAGLLCGIHCIALPAFTAAMLLMGVSLHRQATLEMLLMAGSLLLAILVFLPAAISGRNPFALQAALFALLFYLMGWQLTGAEPLMRQSLTVSASLLLVVAHIHNLWLLRQPHAEEPCGLDYCQPRA